MPMEEFEELFKAHSEGKLIQPVRFIVGDGIDRARFFDKDAMQRDRPPPFSCG